VPVRLPPLRERGSDVGELARHFLDRAAADGLPRKQLDKAAVARLERHSWPGNVRELENLMRRLAALTRDTIITPALVEQQLGVGSQPLPPLPEEAALSDALEQHLARHFASYGSALPPDGLYDRVLAEIERPLLRLTLAAVRGNQLKAARLLGINRNTLRKKLTDLGVGPVVRRTE
jgi:two-component system nitrogen regulation response regulator GlnG